MWIVNWIRLINFQHHVHYSSCGHFHVRQAHLINIYQISRPDPTSDNLVTAICYDMW